MISRKSPNCCWRQAEVRKRVNIFQGHFFRTKRSTVSKPYSFSTSLPLSWPCSFEDEARQRSVSGLLGFIAKRTEDLTRLIRNWTLSSKSAS